MDLNPERQRLLDYMDERGIVAKNVQADTWDEEGFYAYNPITGAKSEKLPWPPGFNYGWFRVLALVADRADFRRLNIRKMPM